MKIWLDNDYKCYITDNGTMRAIDTEYFDGFCQEYIEGHRFVPEGETWVTADGDAFGGEMVAAWKPFIELEKAQAEYETGEIDRLKAELADMKAALAMLGVSDDE